MFCWREHRGGKKWQGYLSHNKGEKYFEMQSGLAPTQLHSSTLGGRSECECMQIFGALFVEDKNAVYGEFDKSTGYIAERIFSKTTPHYLQNLNSFLRVEARCSVDAVLSEGRGWAHLECMRMQACGEKQDMLDSMNFPAHTLNISQEFLKKLLICYARGEDADFETMPQFDVNSDVLSYMIDPWWKVALEYALQCDEKNREWYSLHLGLLYYENGSVEQALRVLEVACVYSNAPIVLRTLGAVYAKLGKSEKALHYYEKAYAGIETARQEGVKEDLMCEYFQLLYDARYYAKLW